MMLMSIDCWGSPWGRRPGAVFGGRRRTVADHDHDSVHGEARISDVTARTRKDRDETHTAQKMVTATRQMLDSPKSEPNKQPEYPFFHSFPKKKYDAMQQQVVVS
jgi:hypothetical protein